MFDRLLVLSENRSLFLFGPRNTGKSTLIKKCFKPEYTLLIDLLNVDEFYRFSRNPNELFDVVMSLPEQFTHVIIDEIQKIPILLDVVHRLLGETNKCYIMTGSSARKLKYGGANLLAGRAFVYHLYALSVIELADKFKLSDALTWGTLPDISKLKEDIDKQQFLQAYAHTYLKEEIASEQLVRELEPFRRFIEVAAQCNGKIINYSNIARDTGVSDKTVASYYSILEDTLVGFFLEAYHNSLRKRLGTKPKFYFFDTGIVRALTRMTDVPLKEKTSYYGEVFEHFIILECQRLASYLKPNYRFSYVITKDGVEIDLVMERPGKPLLLIEIKSATQVDESMLSDFIRLSKDFSNAEAICLCRDKYAKLYQHVRVLPWQHGLREIFEIDALQN